MVKAGAGWILTIGLLSAPAQAQTVTAPVSVAVPTAPASDLDSPLTLGAPLRFSLTRTNDIPFARPNPGCMAEAETSGNAVHGIAVTRALGYRWTPRLSLIGFSSLGCPLESGIGGGLVYALPLSPKFSLVASAGVYALPQIVDRGWLFKTDARLDLQWKVGTDRTMQVGVDALRILQTSPAARSSGQTRGVSLSGAF